MPYIWKWISCPICTTTVTHVEITYGECKRWTRHRCENHTNLNLNKLSNASVIPDPALTALCDGFSVFSADVVSMTGIRKSHLEVFRLYRHSLAFTPSSTTKDSDSHLTQLILSDAKYNLSSSRPI